MIDYIIRYIDLPYTIKGVTVMDSDGFYNVYINSHLSWEEQKRQSNMNWNIYAEMTSIIFVHRLKKSRLCKI